MSEYKDIACDAPNRMEIAIPFTIMRENIDKETFIQFSKQNSRETMVFAVIVASLVLGIGFLLTATFGGGVKIWVMCILMWFAIIVLHYFVMISERRDAKKLLPVFDKLPHRSPFIKITHDNLQVCDIHGEALITIDIHQVNDSKFAHLTGGRVFLDIFFYEDSSLESLRVFEYPLSTTIESCAIRYFECNHEYYYAGNMAWMITNVVKMLQQDPTATHFPFAKKNYINGRAWDEP